MKKMQRGFTLIELMIVVAIIGILAAVAIPQFLKMMSKSKTGEAQLSLDLIKKANKAQWAESTGFIIGTAGPSPAAGSVTDGCCGNPNQKCPVDENDWNDAATAWPDLDFKIDQPNYYVYEYEGSATTLSMTAHGDLNCNGTPGDYVLTGGVDGDGAPTWDLTKPPSNEN